MAKAEGFRSRDEIPTMMQVRVNFPRFVSDFQRMKNELITLKKSRPNQKV